MTRERAAGPIPPAAAWRSPCEFAWWEATIAHPTVGAGPDWAREALAIATARARLRVAADAPVEVVGGPSACAIAFCGPFVVRRPLDAYHRQGFAREVALLRVLARSGLPAAIPELVWSSDDPPVMVYRRIEGSAASTAFRDPEAPPPAAALLFACGYFVGHLHRLRAGSRLPRLPAVEPGMLGYVAQVLAAAELPADIRAFGAAALADWRARSGRALRPCVVHNDLSWKNLLVAGRSRLAGVLDWSTCGIADPHLDFGHLGSWGAERFAPVAAGYQAARGRTLDLRAVDAAVRLRLLSALLHAAPGELPAAIAAARAHAPLA